MIPATIAIGLAVADATVEQWLDQISLRESNNRDDAVGAAGEVSRYQIVARNDKGLPNIWRHYTRKAGGLAPCGMPGSQHVPEWSWCCPECARTVARAIVLDCIRACVRKGAEPTFDRVYKLYQEGGF